LPDAVRKHKVEELTLFDIACRLEEAMSLPRQRKQRDAFIHICAACVLKARKVTITTANLISPSLCHALIKLVGDDAV
jgi:hypothetical protein